MTPASRILVVGATARAAAHSALRAGFAVDAVDLFADADLDAVARARRADPEGWPGSLLDFVEADPERPILYTGPLENHPDLLDELTRRGPLLGNAGHVVREARDPRRLGETLALAGLAFPETRPTPQGLPTDGSWLVKPRRSCGGLNIRAFRGQPIDRPDDVIYQRRVSGRRRAALYLADGRAVEFLGLVSQWIGRPGEPFGYRGGFGPLAVSTHLHARLSRLGEVLATQFGLLGLFGIDLLLRDGEPWTIEINPRYTASVEILELATGRHLVAEHARIFGYESTPPSAHRRGRPRCVGKVVLYSSREFNWPRWRLVEPWHVTCDSRTDAVSDIPAPGTRIRPGEPVVTLIQSGRSLRSSAWELRQRLTRWRQRMAVLAEAHS